jgi:hypothetical protein
LILHINKIYKKLLNIDGDVKINVIKEILWEVDLMIIQEYKIKHKSPKNMLILAVGYGYFHNHYNLLPNLLTILKHKNITLNGKLIYVKKSFNNVLINLTCSSKILQ